MQLSEDGHVPLYSSLVENLPSAKAIFSVISQVFLDLLTREIQMKIS